LSYLSPPLCLFLVRDESHPPPFQACVRDLYWSHSSAAWLQRLSTSPTTFCIRSRASMAFPHSSAPGGCLILRSQCEFFFWLSSIFLAFLDPTDLSGGFPLSRSTPSPPPAMRPWFCAIIHPSVHHLAGWVAELFVLFFFCWHTRLAVAASGRLFSLGDSRVLQLPSTAPCLFLPVAPPSFDESWPVSPLISATSCGVDSPGDFVFFCS